MIKSIIRFSAENKFLVILCSVVVIIISIYSTKNIALDAIPDTSDTQVIIYSRWDRSPDIIEDQVTYPIITTMLGAPKVKVVRGFSDFGFSYVYVIFQDGVDIYWARSRVLEYLSRVQSNLPEGVKLELGPDASAVGWVFQYALVDRGGKYSSHELRSFQDFKLRFQLNSVPGVAEVASIGGYKKQYQIIIDPHRLIAYDISMSSVIQKVKQSNSEIGGRLIEISGIEYMVRGRGYIKSLKDMEDISLGVDKNGTPVYLKNIASISIGPDIRRGISDLDGLGDVVGGIVVMRHGENALAVIDRVKEKLETIKPGLPEGVEVIITYDRSSLINHSIQNLKEKLVEEIIIVSLVILLFLWHFPSAIIPILTIPISVLITFIPLYIFNIGSNLMSLSGIAISIGVLVDGAIVEVENAYKKLEEWESGGRIGDYHLIRLEALLEVGPSVFFSLLVIAVAFLPVFTLIDQEGRLFRPLALSKNLAMAIAAILALTLDPACRMLFTRMDPIQLHNKFLSKIATSLFVGKYYPEEKHPVSRILFKYYEPVCRFAIHYPLRTIGSAIFLFLLCIPLYLSLGTEFMPSLYEESLLYMPTTVPGISVAEAEKLLLLMDKELKSFPEVERVFGKSGRSSSATDSAPFSMMETVVLLRPVEEWRKEKIEFSIYFPKLSLADCGFINSKLCVQYEGLQSIYNIITPFSRRISKEKLLKLLDQKLQIPGVSNAWTMPIKARIDMLSTGVRTPIGIKVQGSDLMEIEMIGQQVEKIIKTIPETRTAFSERTSGGYFLDIQLKRESLARYGITIADAQEIILTAIGGEPVSETIEGRERYTVNIRYPRELRDSIDRMKHILVPVANEAHIPIAEIADLKIKTGPAMIRDEGGFLTGYVFVDTESSDIGGYVEKAKELVSKNIKLPEGYSILWSGQYENILRVKERMKYIIPLTIFVIFLLIYANTKSYVRTLIILLAVPFSLIGAIFLLFVLNYQISVAVWVGMIALMGLDAETGVFMLLYLDIAFNDAIKREKMNSAEDLDEAIVYGAVKRVRPKIMTVLAAFMGLLPIMWSEGAGSDVMKRIAAPMVGGLFSSFLLELLIYPSVYKIWKMREIRFG